MGEDSITRRLLTGYAKDSVTWSMLVDEMVIRQKIGNLSLRSTCSSRRQNLPSNNWFMQKYYFHVSRRRSMPGMLTMQRQGIDESLVIFLD